MANKICKEYNKNQVLKIILKFYAIRLGGKIYGFDGDVLVSCALIDYMWWRMIAVSCTKTVILNWGKKFRNIDIISILNEYVNEWGQSWGTKVGLWLIGHVGKLQAKLFLFLD